jgi:hypothetical protein
MASLAAQVFYLLKALRDDCCLVVVVSFGLADLLI